MTKLNYDRLHGMWAGLPVAWDDNLELDEDAYHADVKACCDAGMHGVYTGGTTGEFYAQDEALFRRIVKLTVDAAAPTATPTQAGCTALSTRLACRRIEIAAELGADGIQVALPFWLALSDDEAASFFREIAAAAGDLPIILYKTERTKRDVSVELFQWLREIAPTLIGCKFGGGGAKEVAPYLAALPDVSFFLGEHHLLDGMRLGVRGSYSSQVYLWPPVMLRYYELCRQGRWDDAKPIQLALGRLYTEGIRSILDKGMMDSAIDRVFGSVRGFLRCGLRCQPPYVHATQEDVDALRAWMETNTPILLGDGL